MLCDWAAHLSADAWEFAARVVNAALREALLLMLLALWSPSEVEAYREGWAAEVRCG